MADVNLTQRDIDYISRVVDTEVPRSMQRRNPEEYGRMVRAVVDTVTNRMASGQFPSTATGVLNQNRQFSKITGPKSLDPYGSVQNTPRAPASVRNIVADHIANRAAGGPSTIGGSLNYANPNFSSRNNLGWINDMIDAGAQKLGIGKAVHYHGNAPGTQPVGQYSVAAEGMPGRFVATPTPRGMLTQAQQSTGIMAAVNPISPGIVERAALPAATTAFAEIEGTKPVGGINPFAEKPKYTLAEQYGLYGQGQAAARNLGLLAQDVASMTPQTYPVANAPQPQPMAQPVSVPEVEPVSVQPASYSSPAVQQGLLSPQEQLAIDAQAGYLAGQPVNRRAQIGGALKKGASAFGGGVLGGLLLGPIGAVAGGLLGPTIVNGLTGATNYPAAPQSAPRGDGKLTEYGERVRGESKQFDRAVRSGRGGLW